MTGYDCICQAIALFEDSLASRHPPIRSVGDLARLTGYSVHHFSRVFQAVTGMPPKDYILGRILTEAAREIVKGDHPLTEIANKSGFPDYESFSRAFRRRFGLPPKRIRLQRHIPRGCQNRLVPLMGDKTQQPDLLEPELVTCEAHHLTGLAFFADPGTPSFHSFWASFMAVKARVTGQTGTFRQFTSWCEDPELDGMAVLCAVETDPGSPQEPLFTCRTVPAARHLRFRHVGDIGGIAQTYAFIYGTWFARHDILPLPGWEFQSYSQNGAITEIHIPIELL